MSEKWDERDLHFGPRAYAAHESKGYTNATLSGIAGKHHSPFQPQFDTRFWRYVEPPRRFELHGCATRNAEFGRYISSERQTDAQVARVQFLLMVDPGLFRLLF